MTEEAALDGGEAVLRDLFAQTKHQRLTAEQVHLCLVEHTNDRSGNGGRGASIPGSTGSRIEREDRFIVQIAYDARTVRH